MSSFSEITIRMDILFHYKGFWRNQVKYTVIIITALSSEWIHVMGNIATVVPPGGVCLSRYTSI